MIQPGEESACSIQTTNVNIASSHRVGNIIFFIELRTFLTTNCLNHLLFDLSDWSPFAFFFSFLMNLCSPKSHLPDIHINKPMGQLEQCVGQLTVTQSNHFTRAKIYSLLKPLFDPRSSNAIAVPRGTRLVTTHSSPLPPPNDPPGQGATPEPRGRKWVTLEALKINYQISYPQTSIFASNTIRPTCLICYGPCHKVII